MEFLIIIALVIVIIAFIWYIMISNKFNRYIVKIDEADSGIDIALTKRYDVLNKMIDVVKSYTKHEKETLFEIINLRKNMTLEEKNEANQKISKNLEKINLLVESYPELKASETYTTLQRSIIEVEEHLQAARRVYNSNVSAYNQMVVSFPSSLIAKQKALIKKEFFEAEETKKADIKINL